MVDLTALAQAIDLVCELLAPDGFSFQCYGIADCFPFVDFARKFAPSIFITLQRMV